MSYIDADPYNWPYNGDLRPENTAVIIIDMQTDFCGKGGYVEAMGYDLSLTQAPIEPIKALLAAMRAKGYHIIHTREGHRPDLTDLPPNKRCAVSRLAQALVIRGHAARSWCAANRDGTSYRSFTPRRVNRSSTSRAKAAFARLIWNFFCERAASKTFF